MRLTNVAWMDLPPGRLRSYCLRAGPTGGELPVSFDQGRHVGEGQRPGSWMAIAFRLPRPVDPADLATAWRAVIDRHGTLRSAFSIDDAGTLRLHELAVLPGEWVQHPVPAGRATREVLREVLDEACAPFQQPSHRLCLIEPVGPTADADDRPVVVIGADHAHVDMWSLLVLARDLLDGIRPTELLPAPPTFAEHTAAMASMPPAPESVHQRWSDLLDSSGGTMPVFPLPLGDISHPQAEVVEVRDVLDADEAARFADYSHALGVRSIATAVSVMTRVTLDLAGAPLRAVFPVHSRHEARFHDSVGWFITNSVIDSQDPDLQACRVAVRQAIVLGSHPLAPILGPRGGMPVRPGMFAISWLDTRRLPVAVDHDLRFQYVSAVIRTDGVMVWFIVNDTGLHLRCRYPDTPEARASVGGWLDQVEAGLRATVTAHASDVTAPVGS